jgi:hypothetical protein
MITILFLPTLQMQLYSLEEHYLVSSSLDKTLALWDMRRYVSMPYVLLWQELFTKKKVLSLSFLMSLFLGDVLNWLTGCLFNRGASPVCLQVFRGHKQGVTGFAVKGSDLISAAGSKIGFSSLSKAAMVSSLYFLSPFAAGLFTKSTS